MGRCVWAPRLSQCGGSRTGRASVTTSSRLAGSEVVREGSARLVHGTGRMSW